MVQAVTTAQFGPRRRAIETVASMQRLPMESFWKIAGEWSASSTSLVLEDILGPQPVNDHHQPGNVNPVLSAHLKTARDFCETIGLTTSSALLKSSIEDPPRTIREMNLLSNAISTELRESLFIHVPSHRAKYFDNESLVSDLGRVRFPKATQEIRTAGNCFAANLSTACVFHCMRALEHGLAALSANLDVVYTTQTWQTLLDQHEKALQKIRSLPNSLDKQTKLQFLSEAISEFRYFKDGWRNHVSHNRVDYDEKEALKILAHVCSFIEVLSRKLEERR